MSSPHPKTARSFSSPAPGSHSQRCSIHYSARSLPLCSRTLMLAPPLPERPPSFPTAHLQPASTHPSFRSKHSAWASLSPPPRASHPSTPDPPRASPIAPPAPAASAPDPSTPLRDCSQWPSSPPPVSNHSPL